MRQIDGTKFSNGSIVIDIIESDKETRLKKIITQVRWTARNGDIKLEEASMLIYGVEKTGELLSASEIVLYATPYFRILPNTSTDLYAEIHDANGNTVTDESYTINFVILGDEDDLGYLIPTSENTTNGIASVEYYSYEDSDGNESIQASADLDGDGTDDVFDIITITISIGAEGIILVPASESSPVEDPVVIDLYIVDASFNYESGLFEGYTDPIILNVTSPATLSVNSITAPEGTASFTLYSNGTPGTVEIIASAPDLDLGYTEVTFTGGAQSIRLTSEDDFIYVGGSTMLTITILDENLNSTPYNDVVTLTGGPFGEGTEIDFNGESFIDVSFSYNVVTEGVEITATGEGLIPDSINIAVLESLTPSYIELKAAPTTGVSADDSDCSVITATVYDDSNPSEIVTNYNGTIYFSTNLPESYFNNDFVSLSSDDGGMCYVYLYSSASGDATITAIGIDGSTTINNQEPNPVVEFYSGASGLRISSSKSPVIADGVDYTLITVEIIDVSENIVSNYSGDISLTTTIGYFEGESKPVIINLNFANEGSKSIKLYSDGIFEEANVTAEAKEEDAGFNATASTTVTFIDPETKNITYVDNSVESYSHYTIIKFDIEVTVKDVVLSRMVISWLANTDLDRIEIMSPKREANYDIEINTNGASSPHPEDVDDFILTSEDPGLSTIRLTFSSNNAMKKEYIYITFYDNGYNYPITVYVPQ